MKLLTICYEAFKEQSVLKLHSSLMNYQKLGCLASFSLPKPLRWGHKNINHYFWETSLSQSWLPYWTLFKTQFRLWRLHSLTILPLNTYPCHMNYLWVIIPPSNPFLDVPWHFLSLSVTNELPSRNLTWEVPTLLFSESWILAVADLVRTNLR